ncbi:MAG: hypothetical protein IJO37_08555 [Ruminiclostridium sp.]|nr:hypothetical protein [Ruminiclostridium sp.]
MHKRFDEYTHAVAQYVRHATGKEKANLRKELEDHMADHAQALLDGGFPEDHAYRVAVESMGDPAEVGKALNKEYPLRWLVLSRLFLVLALLTTGLLLQVFPGGLYNSMIARTDPVHSGFHSANLDENQLTYTDIKAEFPNGDILWVYATAVTWDDTYGYTGHIYTSSYNKNPLRDPLYTTYALTYTLKGTEEAFLHAGGGGGSSYGAAYMRQSFDGLPMGSTLLAHYDRHGTSFTIEIPLPWEEVEVP